MEALATDLLWPSSWDSPTQPGPGLYLVPPPFIPMQWETAKEVAAVPPLQCCSNGKEATENGETEQMHFQCNAVGFLTVTGL